MSELRDFVADLLERRGAAVEALGPDQTRGARACAPANDSWAGPNSRISASGRNKLHGTIAIALEGDWLDRFGALLADEGRWSEREVRLPAPVPPPSDPERLLDRVLDLPNAVWRLQGMSATWTRCLMLAFRFTALSDEKREGLIWLGFNLGTGAVISDILARLRPALAQMADWHMPDHGDQARGRAGMERGDARGAAASAARSRRRGTAWSRFCGRCAAGWSATATVSMPITMTCATRRCKRLAALARADGDRRGGRPAARDAAGRGDRARIPRQARRPAPQLRSARHASNGFRRSSSMYRCNASTC